jgi:hypothetical protein
LFLQSPAALLQLVLQVQDGRLGGHYDLHLPRFHPIHEAVRDGDAHARPRWFVHQVLGDVVMLDSPLLFADVEQRNSYTVDFKPPVVLPAIADRCGAGERDRVRIHVPISSFPVEASHQAVQVRGAFLHPDRDVSRTWGANSSSTPRRPSGLGL